MHKKITIHMRQEKPFTKVWVRLTEQYYFLYKSLCGLQDVYVLEKEIKNVNCKRCLAIYNKNLKLKKEHIESNTRKYWEEW